jgi:outer membrane protein OmpA-like peptidoglycan-associated protein
MYALESPIWSELGPVLKLYAELTGEWMVLTGTPRDLVLMEQVREGLKRGLESGRLEFEVLERPKPLQHPQLEYVRLEGKWNPQRPPEKEKHWIELQLADQDGKPVVGQPFRVLQGDRLVRQGSTNSEGWAGAEDIDPGTSTIVFHDIEEPAWKEQRPLPGKRALASQGPALAPGAEEEVVPVGSATSKAGQPAAEPTPPEKTWFEVTVVDEVAKPIAGVAVTFAIQGANHPAVTDGSGKARIDNVEGDVATVTFADADAIRRKAKPLWDTIRPGEWVRQSTEEHTDVVLLTGEELDPVHVAPATPWKVSIQPRVILARLFGMNFDLNKCFLLPMAISSLKEIKETYDENPDTKLLVVGHTDTTGDPSYNEDLSLDRAKIMVAYLKDQPDPWLKWYDEATGEKHHWGEPEDTMMIDTVALSAGETIDEEPVAWYQKWHNRKVAGGGSSQPGQASLKEDGKIGPNTRRQLILDYMDEDGTSLASDIEPEIHGCGEYFPLDMSLENLDQMPADEKDDITDRRVEFFFFDNRNHLLGIQPPPKGKQSKRGSPEYPEWRRRARETYDFIAGVQTLAVRVCDGARNPIANAPCKVTVEGQEFPTTADESGWVIGKISVTATECNIEWTRPGEEGKPYPFWRQVYLRLGTGDDADWRRLNNLGYLHDLLEEQVSAYQEDFCRPVTGAVADVATEMRAWHSGGPQPAMGTVTAPPVTGAYDPSGEPAADPSFGGSDDEGVTGDLD